MTKIRNCYNFHVTELYWKSHFWFNIGDSKHDQQQYIESEKAYQISLKCILGYEDESKDNQSLMNLKGWIHNQIGIIKE